jgi:hypothetical protein
MSDDDSTIREAIYHLSKQNRFYPSWITLGTDVDTDDSEETDIDVGTEQLCSGCYILGVQGVGKSSLLEEIARQLLETSESVIVFDPHGQLVDDIIVRMPPYRLEETYHLNLKDREYPFGLNVFACADPDNEEDRDRTRNQVMHAFEKLWPETGRGVYFKKLLRHVIILLIEHPDLTLADVPQLLRDANFRMQYTGRLRNFSSQQFWRHEYDPLTSNKQITESGPLLTRIDELLAEPVIRRILCQPQSTINIRQLIEQHKNLLVRLPINEDAYAHAARLVGTMLMAAVYAATFSFADIPESKRPGFTLIVDEFQNFATDEYAQLFAQGRKFKVKQFLAHQFRDQLGDAGMDANKSATLTAQTKIIFQVTKQDAQVLSDDFLPLERQRQNPNLDTHPSHLLDRHASPVVKEFARKYVEKLEEAASESTQRVRGPDPRVSRYESRPRGPSYIFLSPSADFGAGKRLFNPDDAERALTLLDDVLYTGQKEGQLNEAVTAMFLDSMIPLLGHEPKEVETWDTPEHEERYEELVDHLRWLQENKPPDSIETTDLFRTLMDPDFAWHAEAYTRTITKDWVAPDLYVSLKGHMGRIAELIFPSWEWVKEQPEESWLRDSGISPDEEGRIPYLYNGKVRSVDVPLLSDRYKYALSDDLRHDARISIVSWLRDNIRWWRKETKSRWSSKTTIGKFTRRTSIGETGNYAADWLLELFKEEVAEAKKLQQKLADYWQTWEEQQQLAEEDQAYLVERHRRVVPAEQPELERLRRELDEVLAELLKDPVTVGQNTVTSKDVAQSLQHLPRRRAYVRIDTESHVMETLQLPNEVAPAEASRRYEQLQRQTRRDLCQHIADISGPVANPPEKHERAPQPEPTVKPRLTQQPTQQPSRPRMRRSKPVDE